MKFIIDIEPGYNGNYGHAPVMTPEDFAAKTDLWVTDGYDEWTVIDITPVTDTEIEQYTKTSE